LDLFRVSKDVPKTEGKAMTETFEQRWKRKQAEAQQRPTLTIQGKIYNRIPWGSGGHAAQDPCGDCGVEVGQYHVLFCEMEECPKCGCQLLGCDCEPEDMRHGEPGAVDG
jgi:hypothetical protein